MTYLESSESGSDPVAGPGVAGAGPWQRLRRPTEPGEIRQTWTAARRVVTDSLRLASAAGRDAAAAAAGTFKLVTVARSESGRSSH
jgi:hypothetical protein